MTAPSENTCIVRWCARKDTISGVDVHENGIGGEDLPEGVWHDTSATAGRDT